MNTKDFTKTISKFGLLKKPRSKQHWTLITKHLKDPSRFSLPDWGKEDLETARTKFSNLSIEEALYLMKNGMEHPPMHSCGSSLVFNRSILRYSKTCSVCGRKAHNKQTVEIDGVTYTSKTEARKSLGISVCDLDKKLIGSDIKLQNRYTKEGLITKEVLQNLKDSRYTQSDMCKHLKISRDHLTVLLDYYGIDPSWKQVSDEVYEFIKDKDRFIQEFSESNSEELSRKYGCSPSTILQWADRYGIDRTARFQSSIERTLVEYIKTLDKCLDVIERDKTAIGSEIDIYVPSKRLGIECDGLYYHSAPEGTLSRNKHKEKNKMAYKNKIELLRFVDIGETKDKLDVVKSMLRVKLGYACRKIGARKCEYKILDENVARVFLEENHLGCYVKSDCYVGLIENDELVMCMSFTQSSTGWTVSQFATLKNCVVVGGVSKLLKNFGRNVDVLCNIRYGNGKSLEKAGLVYKGMEDTTLYTDMKRLYIKKPEKLAVREYPECGLAKYRYFSQ